MRIRKILIIGILLFTISCGEKTGEETGAVPEDKHGETTLTLTEDQVNAIGLQTGQLELRNLKSSLKVNGKLMLPPQNQAQVSMLTGGIVKSILVNEGNFVSQGQTLATLQNNEIVQLQQDYLENKSQLKYLEAEYQRQKRLQEDNINATKTFQQTENEWSIAKAKQKGIMTRLTSYGINPATVHADHFTTVVSIVAPISGYVHHINITMGKFADANSILFEIVDNRFLHLDLTIFEKDIHKLKTGQKVTFTDANDVSHIHPATIYSLDKAFQENQQAIIAHAKIDEKTELLLPGMYVEARIQVDNYEANALPEEAVVNDGEAHYIFIQTNKNTFRQVAVKTGATDLGFIEILPLENLDPQTIVVTKGAYYLLSQLTKGESGHHD